MRMQQRILGRFRMSRAVRSVSQAKAPDGRYRVITAAEAQRRFKLYPKQIYELVELGLVHDVGDKPRDPRKSSRGHTRYPEWELANVVHEMEGGATIVELAERAGNSSSGLYLLPAAA